MEIWRKNKVMEIHKKVIEKSCNFSTAFSEARMRNSDNSISIGYCSVLAMAYFQFMF